MSQPDTPPRSDPPSPEDWEARYASENTPWDLGQPNPSLREAVAQAQALGMATSGKAILPGCGRGHDGLPLLKAGWQVLGVDLAPSALAEAGERWKRFGSRGQTRLGSVLELPEEVIGSFDLVLEHTCFCALDPSMRDAYLLEMARALKPGGWLVGIFFMHDRPSGPPWGISEAALRGLVESGYEVVHAEPAAKSIARREPMVEWAWILRRRP